MGIRIQDIPRSCKADELARKGTLMSDQFYNLFWQILIYFLG